ncbi:uncharacterized protein LOC143028083 [Oratosquilla oratoria]|uniref:uncharacterized protein LOC143028083 n=1 Tax=Oratosquilla oratoria TaxID=337810 RepID=UPI003F76517B
MPGLFSRTLKVSVRETLQVERVRCLMTSMFSKSSVVSRSAAENTSSLSSKDLVLFSMKLKGLVAGVGPGTDSSYATMKDGGDSDKDPGRTTMSSHKGVPSPDHLGMSLGPHLGATSLSRAPHLASSTGSGIPGFPGLHPPLPFGALNSPHQVAAAAASGMLYPGLMNTNLNQALLASIVARSTQLLSQPPPHVPLLPPSTSAPTLASLQSPLAAAPDASSRHRDLLASLAAADSARQQELLSTLSKLASVSSASSSSSSSSSPLPYFPPSDSPMKPDSAAVEASHSKRASSISPTSHSRLHRSSSSGYTGGSVPPTSMPPPLNHHTSLLSASLVHQLGTEMAAAATTGGLNTSETPSPTAGSSPPSSGGSNGRPDPYASSTTPGRKSSVGRPDRVFTCKICNRSFGYKHVLQNHERTHTGEKPFECKECHKRFTRDHHLKTHMRLHTGEKPYHCTHCDRQFVQVANLRRHLRVHTGERPYACELCAARFSDSNQLKAHMLIHKGEKPFECPRCMGRFRRRHHLMHHKCSRDLDHDKRMMDPIQFAETAFSESDTFSLGPDLEEEEDDYADEEPQPSTLLGEEPLPLEKKRERKARDPRRIISHHMSGILGVLEATSGRRDYPPMPDQATAHILRGLQHHHRGNGGTGRAGGGGGGGGRSGGGGGGDGGGVVPGPVQTEPEDLSVAGVRSRDRNYSGLSVISALSQSSFLGTDFDFSRDSLGGSREEDIMSEVEDPRYEEEDPVSSNS